MAGAREEVCPLVLLFKAHPMQETSFREQSGKRSKNWLAGFGPSLIKINFSESDDSDPEQVGGGGISLVC
jgi:hypothetical protein